MKIIRQNQIVEEKVIEVPVKSLVGDVNRFGIKIVPTSSGYQQWIIDAKTGKAARREGYECMESNGLYLWIKKGETLRAIDGMPYPSLWL